MDEVKIVSGFTRNLISKLVRTIVFKKTGYNIAILINEMKTTIDNGKTHIHLDLDAEIDKEELLKILKAIGLN